MPRLATAIVAETFFDPPEFRHRNGDFEA